ncbi:MAG: hypothetical protein DWQ04_14055 [Chloroflexi bacterium]|nr:MAG: hypothetical protein DWQ04_14055 [Chloroflexota bacterium]
MTILQKKIVKYILAGLVVMLILFVRLLLYIEQNKKTIHPLRQIESVESFEFLWSTQVSAYRSQFGSCTGDYDWVYMYLDVDNRQIILPTWQKDNFILSSINLSSFDLDTGKTNWHTPLDASHFSISNNKERIFIVSRGPEPSLSSCASHLHYCESAQISSYDIISGEQAWSTIQSNMNSSNKLCVMDDVVSILGQATRSNYQQKVSLDANTGEKIPFQGIRSAFAEHDFFAAMEIIEKLGFDRLDITSKYVTDGRFLFFLTSNDSTLWVVDMETPEIVGRVQFDGNQFARGNYYDQYAIAPVDNNVVVYLADSQQLFTLRFLPTDSEKFAFPHSEEPLLDKDK